jgi:hypothetical protein
MNGCSEQGILLNALFQDAKRKSKDLTVTAIHLSNAFGSVPHDLIMSTLKQLNFLMWVGAIIKDMYENAKSRVEDTGRQAGSINWGKDVKRGCLLSPLLLNLCLESLLETTGRNENIQRPCVRINVELLIKVIVQAYADDVILVSESEDGITQVLQILDQFVE